MAPTTNEKVSNHIPDDVAFSILSKLPLKSLKHFTSVRKSWTLLFQNPYFMSMFGKNFVSPHNPLYNDTCLLLKQTAPGPNYFGIYCLLYLLYGERFENKLKLKWPLPFEEEDTHEWPLHISGSAINGILCLFDVNHETGILWNPATKEFKRIRASTAEFVPYNIDTTTFTVHGFGYDHVRDDYKVIRRVRIGQNITGIEDELGYMPTGQGHLWEIYSLRSNRWGKLDVNMPRSIAGSEAYLNGMCHWLGETNDETSVVSFNLSSEVFFTTSLLLDMHDSFDTKLVKRHLVVLNGSIAMISKYAKTASFHISILGELGVKESWAKLFIVGPLPCIRHPIGAGKKGDMFFRTKDDELICFDLIT